jgi:DNA (cytosine-5)-methyltransferase 1
MKIPIKVIDLFAGPGGLGEGFSFQKNHFKIAISIEKEASAHKTLLLRAFYRQFDIVPEEYYQFLKGKLGATPEELLYKIPRFKKEFEAASKEARRLTLGVDNEEIFQSIRQAIRPDEDCILIGGPPCQAYSLAGKARNLNNINYKAEEDKRNFLYLEYLEVIARFQPKIFVMENVKGMLSAKINNEHIFDSIRHDLSNPCDAVSIYPDEGRKKFNYKIFSLVLPSSDNEESSERDPREYIIYSEKYGIPQRRHRVILMGLREDIADINQETILLLPTQNQVSIKSVIDDLPKLRSGLSKVENTSERWLSSLMNINTRVLGELKDVKLCAVADYIESLKDSFVSYVDGQGKLQGLRKTKHLKIKSSPELEHWYSDPRLGDYVINHETRGHLEADLHRYLFSSSWAAVAEKNKWIIKFPKSKEYPSTLKPKHRNFDSGKFADRFRVQLAEIPATTITSHISKDGHYFIHYDPLQCRSLTVREAARVQTFPDNYFFVGNRTEQYVQVGNAVPPFLAKKIADIVYSILSK